MAGGVRDKDRGWKRAKRQLAQLADNIVVAIGIQGEQAEVSRGELNNAGLGSVHEFGSSDGRIPERSFLRSTVDGNRPRYADLIEKATGKIVDGKMSVNTALGLIGERVKADVQNRIRSGIPPPLADSTIARKGSSKPLIDTAQMLNSLTYKVRKASEGKT